MNKERQMNKLKQWWNKKDEKLKKKFKKAMLICLAVLIVWVTTITLIALFESLLGFRIIYSAEATGLSFFGITVAIVWGKD